VELFGITNVPFGIWVDETGTIVRPAEVAFSGRTAMQRPAPAAGEPKADAPPRPPRPEVPAAMQETMAKMMGNVDMTGKYTVAVRDWVAKSADSEYVLGPAEVVERSRPRPPEFGLAAAHFALAQHLHRAGHPLDAVPHFDEAHRLDPENWSYRRQAFALVQKEWGKVYDSDLLSEVATIGAETFYPPLDL
jgi:hypothetical protein